MGLSQVPLPTQYKTNKRGTSIPSAGLEPAIPAVKGYQTYTLDRTVTGIGGWMAYYVPAKRYRRTSEGNCVSQPMFRFYPK
jgi:hypothetical protein